MHNPFKEFFYFSQREKKSILLLMVAIGIVFLAGSLLSTWRLQGYAGSTEALEPDTTSCNYQTFMASIKVQEHTQKRQYIRRQYTAREFPDNPYFSDRRDEETIPLTLSPFNPNTADSITLRQLGLSARTTANLLSYRSKGGRFRKVEDIRKIYGMTEEQYATLAPFVRIAPKDTVRGMRQLYTSSATSAIRTITDVPTTSSALSATSASPAESRKYPSGTIVSLNLADTTELKHIPGIGSSIARLIVNYRSRLGGFYRIEQLEEIHLDYRQLNDWFSIDTTYIRHINLTPYTVWLATVVVSGISYLSYLLKRYVFHESGILVSGIIGGLYSSTATISVLARKSRKAPAQEAPEYTAAMLLAVSMMFLRFLILIGIFSQEILATIYPYLLIMSLVTAGVAWQLHRKRQPVSPTDREMEEEDSSNPLEFKVALIFAILFVVFTIVTHYTLLYAGTGGLNALSFIAGLSDITPFILNLLQGSGIAVLVVTACCMQAIVSNIAVNLCYALFFAGRRSPLRKWLLRGFGSVIAINILLLIFFYLL